MIQVNKKKIKKEKYSISITINITIKYIQYGIETL